MPKCLFHGFYTPEGIRGLMAEGGTKRLEVSRRALGSAGGHLEAFNFSFREEDFYIIVDLPDNVAATAVLSVGNASDTFRIKMTPLVTAEQVDAAMRKQVEFRPPGH